MENWLPDDTLQKIAAENNLPETAFIVPNEGLFELRWFSPEVEIDLCGHATLASAFILMNHIDKSLTNITFLTQSEKLSVEKNGRLFIMDFPARPPELVLMQETMQNLLGIPVLETYKSRDLIVLLPSETAVREYKPDFEQLKKVKDGFAVVITAKGDDCDFVSRFFAPNTGIPKDPVTGSSHTTLIPLWSKRLGKKNMTARKLSARGGSLLCEDGGKRVKIGGRAVLYLSGEINC